MTRTVTRRSAGIEKPAMAICWPLMPMASCEMVTMALTTHPMINGHTRSAPIEADRPRSICADFPSYRNSRISMSVTMPVRRRMRLNKTTASAHPIIGDQYCQTAGTPYWRTSAQTHKGVSAAKLVATMDEPAIYHFKVRPETKKLSMLCPALRLK